MALSENVPTPAPLRVTLSVSKGRTVAVPTKVAEVLPSTVLLAADRPVMLRVAGVMLAVMPLGAGPARA